MDLKLEDNKKRVRNHCGIKSMMAGCPLLEQLYIAAARIQFQVYSRYAMAHGAAVDFLEAEHTKKVARCEKYNKAAHTEKFGEDEFVSPYGSADLAALWNDACADEDHGIDKPLEDNSPGEIYDAALKIQDELWKLEEAAIGRYWKWIKRFFLGRANNYAEAGKMLDVTLGYSNGAN